MNLQFQSLCAFLFVDLRHELAVHHIMKFVLILK